MGNYNLINIKKQKDYSFSAASRFADYHGKRYQQMKFSEIDISNNVK